MSVSKRPSQRSGPSYSNTGRRHALSHALKRMRIAVGMAMFALAVQGTARADAIFGGNPVNVNCSSGCEIDSYQNFVVVDRNHPIDGAGTLTEWTAYFTGRAVQLLIVREDLIPGEFSIVGQSGFVSGFLGVKTVPLTTGIDVQAGDLIALYVTYDNTAGGVYYTSNGPVGVDYTNNDTGFPSDPFTRYGSIPGREYLVQVSGTAASAVPEPGTLSTLASGLSALSIVRLMRRRRRS